LGFGGEEIMEYYVDVYEQSFDIVVGKRVVSFAAALYDVNGTRVAEFYTKEAAEQFMNQLKEKK
jgi:hypothetical protein